MLFILKSLLFAALFTVFFVASMLAGTGDVKRKTLITILVVTFLLFFGFLMWYGEQSFNDLAAYLGSF